MNDHVQGLGDGVADTASLTVVRQLAAGAALREDPELLVQRLFTTLAAPMGLDFFIHYRYDGEGHDLDLASTSGIDADQLPGLRTVIVGEAVCGRVASTRTAAAHFDVDRSDDESLALAASLGGRAYASFPLLDGAELLGTLSFGSRTRTSLTDADLEVLGLVTDVLAAAVAHHRDHQVLASARDELEVLTRRVQQLTEPTAGQAAGQDTALRAQVEQLTLAVASRDHVAKVKGMLMLTLAISDEQSWQLLVQLSQTTHRKLRDVATLVGGHLLEGRPLPDDLASRWPAPTSTGPQTRGASS